MENYKQQISLPHVGHAGGVLSFLVNVGRKTSPAFPVLACSRSQEGTRVGCGITTTEIPPEPLHPWILVPHLLFQLFFQLFPWAQSRHCHFASQPCSSWISNPWVLSGKQNTFPTRPLPSGKGNLCWKTTVLLFLGAPFVLPIIYLPVWAIGFSSSFLCCCVFVKTLILCFILLAACSNMSPFLNCQC